MEIVFTEDGSYSIYGLPRAPGDTALPDTEASSDQLVFRGVTLKFEGTPAGGERVVILAGKNITIDPVTKEATAEAAEYKQGILGTIASLRMSLENPTTDNGGVRDAVAVALTNLDHGMVSVDAARGNIGARLNVIETTMTDNEDVALVNKAVQAELKEIDYAEALSRLSFQTIILEAAQQSYVKISGLNLFNAMR